VISTLSKNWESGERFFDEPGLIETCIVFVLSDKRKVKNNVNLVDIL